VSAEWDDRGLFDIDTGGEAPAGPLSYQVHVRIGAEGVPEETLRGIVAWCEQHSPVGDALSRAVPGHIHIEVL
jgi:hypothetical protein